MASVTAADEERRAQLILIGGLALAVILVVLALVLNTLIFTGNLASRDVDAGVDEAIGFQDAVSGAVGDRMDAVAGTGTYSSQRSAVVASVGDVGDSVPAFGAAAGASTTVQFVDATEGRRVYQDSTGAFDSESGSADWQLLDDTEHVRRFSLTADAGGLLDLGSGALSDSLQIVFDGPGSDDYTIYVYVGDATSKPEVRVERDGTLVGECTDPSGGEMTVDVTAATLDGVECPYLGFLDDIGGSYDVLVRNGDVSSGTYSVVAPASTVAAATAGGDPPDIETVVYETRIRVSYRASGVSYDSVVRVAPGEQRPVRELGADGTTDGGGTATPTPTGATPTPTGPVDPTIDSTTYTPNNGEDVGGNNGNEDRIEYTVDWTVSDSNGNLDEVQVEIFRATGSPGAEDTATQAVSGSGASGTLTVTYRSNNACGNDYDIVLTVEDTTGRVDTETRTVTASC